MFIGNVLLTTIFGLEYQIATVARVPMFGLFMSPTEMSRVCRPASIAPTAFDLVQVVDTIIKVITHAILSKGTATALRHGLLVPSIVSAGMQRRPRIVRTVCECSKESLRHYTRAHQAPIHRIAYQAAKVKPVEALICLQRSPGEGVAMSVDNTQCSDQIT